MLHGSLNIFLYPEQNPVDRLELQTFIMHVLDLHQSVACRMVHPHLRLHLLPDGLGGSQRVIAVAHREEQHRFVRADTVLGREDFRLRQSAQGRHDLVFQFRR